MASPSDAPVFNPRNGLRQRWQARAGAWRVWWEPTAKERAAGAVVVDLSAMKPGDAQRRADQLRAQWAKKMAAGPRRVAFVSVQAAADDYLRSRHYLDLAGSTRRGYAADLRALMVDWGGENVAALDAPMVERWYDRVLADKGAFRARALGVMLQVLCKHAERRGWRSTGSNPVKPVSMKVPQGRSRAGTWAELEACLQAARSLGWRSVRAALMLVIFGGGQRQTDVLRAMPADFARRPLQLMGMAEARPFLVWTFTRSKRGNDGVVVINPAAAPVLRAQLRRAGAVPGRPLIFDEGTGRAYSKDLFFKRWEAVRAEAARTVPSVATLQWRDLRRTFSRMARMGGASVDDVGDVIGNSAARSDKLREVYMAPQMETAARATLAVKRPEKKRA